MAIAQHKRPVKRTIKKPAKRPGLRLARLRIIPLTMTMLSLLLLLQINELYRGGRALGELLEPRSAHAEDAKKEEGKDAKSDTKPEEKSSDAKSDTKDAKPEEKSDSKPADDTSATAKKEESKDNKSDAKDEKAGDASADTKSDSKDTKADGSAEGDKKEEGKKEEKKKEDEPKTLGTGKTTIKAIEELKAKQAQPQFTQTEIDILQNLVKRREELEKREQDLEVKSAVLDATEKRINDKVNEMKTLQADLGKVVEQYNKHQDAEIRGLVKIYETMKPGDAANIFNELEMPILLEVVDKMSERKVAPVLAGMNPKRAREVTEQLAEMRRARANAQKAAAMDAPPSASAPVPNAAQP